MEFWSLLSQIPREGWAVFVAPAGWLGAIALRAVTTGLMNLVRFDKLADRIGLAAFLKTGQVPYTPSRLLGIAVYWVALLSTLIGVSVLLDLALVTAISERLAGLAPGLLAAVLIVIIGFLLVSFLANFVVTLARNAAWTQTRLLGRAVRGLGIVVVLGVASEQLGINLSLVNSFFLVLAGGISLGLALAFGLAGQEQAKQALKNWAAALSEREHSKGPDLEG